MGEAAANQFRRGGRGHLMGRPTLGNGASKQPFRARHGQERADAHRTSRLAENRDVCGITAKRRNILLHPRQGGELVEQALVGQAWAQVEESVGTNWQTIG